MLRKGLFVFCWNFCGIILVNTLLNRRLGRLGVGNYAVTFLARFASSSLKIFLAEGALAEDFIQK
jgi:hypothetical protein